MNFMCWPSPVKTLLLFLIKAITPLMVELAEAWEADAELDPPKEKCVLVDTPDQHSIEEVSRFLNIPAEKCLKTLLVKAEDGGIIALLLRGDHELNILKTEKLEGVAVPLEFATDSQIQTNRRVSAGVFGSTRLKYPYRGGSIHGPAFRFRLRCEPG